MQPLYERVVEQLRIPDFFYEGNRQWIIDDLLTAIQGPATVTGDASFPDRRAMLLFGLATRFATSASTLEIKYAISYAAEHVRRQDPEYVVLASCLCHLLDDKRPSIGDEQAKIQEARRRARAILDCVNWGLSAEAMKTLGIERLVGSPGAGHLGE